MMNRFYHLILLILYTVLFTGCPSPWNPENSDTPDLPDVPIVEDESLFIPSSGKKLFSTNIFEFGAGRGATYWMEEESSVPDFYDFTVELGKNTGHPLGGFGILFSQRDSGSTDFSALTVFINTEGEYCAGLIKDGDFTYIKEWSDSSSLIRGYNQKNKITIEEVLHGQYRILFNGTEELTMEDPDDPVHRGGGFGYIAVISPLENFPSVPVTIEFAKMP